MLLSAKKLRLFEQTFLFVRTFFYSFLGIFLIVTEIFVKTHDCLSPFVNAPKNLKLRVGEGGAITSNLLRPTKSLKNGFFEVCFKIMTKKEITM